MCETCGCGVISGNEHLATADGKYRPMEQGRTLVTVLEDLLVENEHRAAHNREHFDQHGVLVLNLMSSPGAGKTSLLEATIAALGDEVRIAVIEGDLETEKDAERIRAHGIPAVQITTGSACHLDAHMVHDAMSRLDLDQVDLLFIENVGNLVCPASFDLGQHRNVTLLSVPEGDDKPAKYPVIFRAADIVLLTKTDLLVHLTEFNPVRAEQNLRRLATEVPFVAVTTREPAGIEHWTEWLRAAVRSPRARHARGDRQGSWVEQEGTRVLELDAGHDQHYHHARAEGSG